MKNKKILIGCHEWCSLPDLGIKNIRAKIDTGAKTSALHAENIHLIKKNGVEYISFILTPFLGEIGKHQTCIRKIKDLRNIISSNGIKEQRFIIDAIINLGGIKKNIDISLTNRHLMRFNLLLGREALIPDYIIDPSKKNILTQSRRTLI